MKGLLVNDTCQDSFLVIYFGVVNSQYYLLFFPMNNQNDNTFVESNGSGITYFAIIIFMVILVVGGIIIYLTSQDNNPSSTDQNLQNQAQNDNNTANDQAQNNTVSGPVSSMLELVNISINNSSFPDQTTIIQGQTVKWTNDDTVAHTVTFADLDSGDIGPGQTFIHIFNTAGTFEYKCSIHLNMTSKIIVEASAGVNNQ